MAWRPRPSASAPSSGCRARRRRGRSGFHIAPFTAELPRWFLSLSRGTGLASALGPTINPQQVATAESPTRRCQSPLVVELTRTSCCASIRAAVGSRKRPLPAVIELPGTSDARTPPTSTASHRWSWQETAKAVGISFRLLLGCLALALRGNDDSAGSQSQGGSWRAGKRSHSPADIPHQSWTGARTLSQCGKLICDYVPGDCRANLSSQSQRQQAPSRIGYCRGGREVGSLQPSGLHRLGAQGVPLLANVLVRIRDRNRVGAGIRLAIGGRLNPWRNLTAYVRIVS
jgi:hypothetical protein